MGFVGSLFRDVDIDNGGETTEYDPVLTVPAGAVEGDRMTALIVTTDTGISGTPTAPSGWTLEASGSMPVDGTGAVSPPGVWIYGKDVSAADESGAGVDTYTWTFGGTGTFYNLGALILTGPADFGQFAKNELTGTRTSIDAPTVTTTVADENVFHCAIRDGAPGISLPLPAGIQTVFQSVGETGGAGAAIAVVRESFPSTGATGAKTFTHPSDESNGFTFSLEPTGGGIDLVKSVDVSNGGATGGFDPVLTVPGAAVEGQRMTAVVMTTDNAPDITPTAPSNETWTLEASGSMPVDGTGATSPPAVWIYGKDVSADDETNAGTKTYTWTFGGGEEQLGALILTDGADFGQFAKNELTGTRTSIDAPTVTTTVASEVVFHCALKDAGDYFTVLPSNDAGVAEEIIGDSGDAGGALVIVAEEFLSTGATGAKTFTHGSQESNGFTFSLEPTGGGGGARSPRRRDALRSMITR